MSTLVPLPFTAFHCLRRMAHNNAWASYRLLAAVGRLSDGEYRQERTSFFPSLYRTLVHILFVDLYYLGCMEQTGIDRHEHWAEMDRFEREESFARLSALQRETDLRLVRHVDGMSQSAIEEPVALPRPHGVQMERRGDVLLHLYEHQIHHRGQVRAMLAGTHVKPPQLDEFFLAEDLPLRRTELEALGLPIR
jgi:uncharacterized damage-inducible protein DinB